MGTFYSQFREVGKVEFPGFQGIRVQLMPVVIHDPSSLPDELLLNGWLQTFARLCGAVPEVMGTGYLTIDQRYVVHESFHRRPGLHVDGYGAWGAAGWGARGMIMASDVPACAAWAQEFEGLPLQGKDCGDPKEGNCDHLRKQCRQECKAILKANTIYWCDALCVHESLPVSQDCYRTFIRLSLPSTSEWPANCTWNPKVKPVGPIGVPRRTKGEFSY